MTISDLGLHNIISVRICIRWRQQSGWVSLSLSVPSYTCYLFCLQLYSYSKALGPRISGHKLKGDTVDENLDQVYIAQFHVILISRRRRHFCVCLAVSVTSCFLLSCHSNTQSNLWGTSYTLGTPNPKVRHLKCSQIWSPLSASRKFLTWPRVRGCSQHDHTLKILYKIASPQA